MCGIAGFAGEGSEKTLRAMTQTLIHRGPDDQGYFFDAGEVGFGFRRLAIIDLQTGNQPVFSEDREVAVMLNGEIYNFQELRHDLARRHTFVTQSDTEVIAHLYEEVGKGVFERLNGMFAIAIWDAKSHSLILARDRFGKKPLYYTIVGGTLVFGSEPKALFAYPGVRRTLDPTALNVYLTHEYVPSPRSIYRDIAKLEAGHCLVFREGAARTEPYYEIVFRDPEPQVSPGSCRSALDDLLRDAVSRRLIADVPLGVFLSGGLDSSTIAYYARLAAQGRIKTYSIGFSDASFDEAAHARVVARHLDTDHHEAVFDASRLLELVPEITEKLDEPIADPAILPNYLLSRFARQSVTVALGGDGGDELFMGYPTFQAHRIAEWYLLLPRLLRERMIPAVVSRLPASFGYIPLDYRLKRFLLGLSYGPEHRDPIWIGAFTPPEKRELFTPEFAALLGKPDDFAVTDRHLLRVQDRPFLEQIAYLYQKTYLTDDILAVKDRASMYASLELRAPFLDYRVVDFANALPIEFKLRGFTTKYLLKRLMADRLPRSVVRRRKQGFGVPIARWLQGALQPTMQELLSRDRIERAGIFRHEPIGRLVEDHLAGRRDNRKSLWTLIVFELWRAQWLP